MKKQLQVSFSSEADMQNESFWNALPKHHITSVNWPNFPYCPDVAFRIVHDGQMLYLKYEIREKHQPRTEHTNDLTPIYQDSCVEFFLLDRQGEYHNLEFNSQGYCLASRGNERMGREAYSVERLKSIVRYPLGVELSEEGYVWSLIVKLPFQLFDLKRGESYDVNFYKCGDLTEERHYLSWNPISTIKPDFHRPEYFGTMLLE